MNVRERIEAWPVLAAAISLGGIFATMPVVGQEPTGRAAPTEIEGLGRIAFPVSGAPEAQTHFLRGVLLLHSFEYRPAAESFRQAREIDPDFAMAYWGEAITHNHPAWNEQDAEAARAALVRYAPTAAARAARAPTRRERDWLAAVDVLFGDGPKPARDTAYSQAMKRLSEAYPEDREALAFYALSILGLNQGSRHVPAYMRAGALALELLGENPRHPGAAHYAIHSFDDPTHAPLGLRAARAYAEIAPEAAHANHMTSHIFLALGLWAELIEANERAAAIMDRARRGHGLGPMRCGHFNEWRLYGLLQVARFADAVDLLRGCLEDASSPDFSEAEVDWSSRLSGGTAAGATSTARDRAGRSFARMRALLLSDWRVDAKTAGAFLESPILIPDASDAYSSLMDLGTGLAAARRGDHSKLQEALENIEKRGADDGAFLARYVPVWEAILRSLLMAGVGDLDAAVSEARRAAELEADLPRDYGPPLATKPPRELEGELLLESGRTDEARTAFSIALDRTPLRALSLIGYERTGGSR